ncbi:hypothetical protein L1987_12121 [Smallanthus sonchifolius]|uniref:Uncharacterized protein n=1 Tax=Smallanthus sonchifolius TaxID=185202 RepID=A0ACB9JD93_9ASTR|nr:hypothetical protein L1987_12121 [Smallanthus sonchifolius]
MKITQTEFLIAVNIDLLGNDPLVIRATSNLKIRWSSPLSSSCSLNIMGPKFFQIDDLRFELGSVLFFYGSLLRQCASQVLVRDLVQSATLFRKAAGVYHHLGHEVLPSLKATLTSHRPPEATSSVSSVMSLICLAEAQAEEKQTADGLLSKLHYGVVQLLDEATDFYSTAAKECKDISPDLMKNKGRMESWRTVIKQEVNTLTDLLRKYEHENDFVWNEKVPFDDSLPLLQGKKIATCIPYCPARLERRLKLKI